jgi:hypothetical protein
MDRKQHPPLTSVAGGALQATVSRPQPRLGEHLLLIQVLPDGRYVFHPVTSQPRELARRLRGLVQRLGADPALIDRAVGLDPGR